MYADILRPLDYESLVLATKPVFYVPMQGVVQEVVKQKIATVSAVSPVPCDGPFPGSTGYRFSASTADNDVFDITTDASYHPGDTFSIGGWMKLTAKTDCIPLGLGNGDVAIYINASSRISINKQNGANVFITTAGFANSPWLHVIGVKNAGTSAGIYVNGVSKAGTYTNQTIVAKVLAPRFGAAETLTSDFDGWLSHWAIWNRVLTAGEVMALYQTPLS